MKRFNLFICLFILLAGFSIDQNCLADLSYPSVYANISYKDYFNAETLTSIQSTNPSIDQTKAYVSDGSPERTFKMFFPKGATRLTAVIYFIGWVDQRCAKGATVKYWIGSTEPSTQGSVWNDLWKGNYMEQTTVTGGCNIGIRSYNSEPSTEAAWIYFRVSNPVECPSYCSVRHGYILDLEKYRAWYKSVPETGNPGGWESNGDPPYETSVVTPTISLSSLPIDGSTVTEGNTITYNVRLTNGTVPAGGLPVPYTLGGTAQLDQDYTCTSCQATGGYITIPYGSTSTSFVLNITDDSDTDQDETLTLALGTVSGYTVNPSSSSITIKEQEVVTPTISLSSLPIDGNTVDEGGSITYTVTLTDGVVPAGGLPVPYTLSGTAQLNQDYACTSCQTTEGYITIPYGSTSENLVLNISTDSDTDPDETLALTLGTVSDYTVNPSSSSITIKDVTPESPELLLGSVTFADGLLVSSFVPGGDNVTVKYQITNSGGDFEATPARTVLTFTTTTADEVQDELSSLSAEIVEDSSVDAAEEEVFSMSGSTPVNESNDVSINSLIRLSFNREITLLSAERIGLYYSEPSTGEELKTDALISVDADNKTTLIIKPNNDMLYNTAYTVKVESGALQDSQGNDFNPSEHVAVYLSRDSVLDMEQDEKLRDIWFDEDVESRASLQKEIEVTADDLEEYAAGRYYIFVVLIKSDGTAASTPQAMQIDILKVLDHSNPVIEEITENFAEAPVYLGDMVEGGQNSQLTTNFPAYSEAVDHYVAILPPDSNGLIFVQYNSDQPLTTDMVKYSSTGIGEALSEEIFSPQPNAMFSQLGKWWVFWLTAPAGIGTLEQIVDSGVYELGYYTFTLPGVVESTTTNDGESATNAAQ